MRSLSLQTAVAALVLLIGCPAGMALAEGLESDDSQATTNTEPRLGSLVVHSADLESSDGNLRFVLFDSKKNFLKHPIKAEIVEINEQQGTWLVEGLVYGTYAVLVHHDIDASGKMERHWYGKPKEPTGASNDAPSRFGPPKFKDAEFELASPMLEMTVVVK